MTTKKLHCSLLFFSLIVTGFIYLDIYVISLEGNREVVTYIQQVRSYRGDDKYLLGTNEEEYMVTEGIYLSLNAGDSIVVKRSIVSGSVQKIVVEKENVIYEYSTGYLRWGSALLYGPIILAGNILVLIFYRKLRNPRGKARLTYAIFIITLILLFFHIKY